MHYTRQQMAILLTHSRECLVALKGKDQFEYDLRSADHGISTFDLTSHGNLTEFLFTRASLVQPFERPPAKSR